MKLQAHYSIVASRGILREINKIGMPTPMTYEHWSNCREQGYHIATDHRSFDQNRAVCFAQNRNSDELVVIYGLAKCFDITTNQPDEDTWRQRRTFRYDEVKRAAEFIVKYLTGKI